MSLSAETRETIERARDRYPHARSAILPSLWALQHEHGHLTSEGMAEVATLLGVTPSEVEAVATFYSMYFQKPHGRHEVLVCINVSCALRGADAIVSHLEHTLHCASGATTRDGEFTWASTVECLGACGGAPAMQVDHRFEENLTPARVDDILQRVRAGDGNGHLGGAQAAGRSGAMVQPPGPHSKHQRRPDGQPER
ncbi:MAG: NADH-quinone oxidoreductase subunit NuoE [Candidatus Dormibacteria bacterium]